MCAEKIAQKVSFREGPAARLKNLRGLVELVLLLQEPVPNFLEVLAPSLVLEDKLADLKQVQG